MQENEILDSNFNEEKSIKLLEAVSWWERKRLIYNALLLSVELLVMFSYLDALKIFGIENAIGQTIFVNIIANVFYSSGWGIEILGVYYFKKFTLTNTIRMILFVIGLLFSLLIALIAYEEALFLLTPF